MTQRDLSEIKRRLNPEHRNPTVIRGRYVNNQGATISEFTEDVGRLPEEELTRYMALFRRVLSGAQGQNLVQVGMAGAAAQEDEAHQRLLALVRGELRDDAPVNALFDEIAACVREWHEESGAQSVEESMKEPNQLILLMYDCYDIPRRNRNDEVDLENSDEVFTWVLCCVCPVKRQKAFLGFREGKGDFAVLDGNWAVSAPELGFMFPAYEDRAADIYSALFYTKDSGDTHEAFLRRIFHAGLDMAASEQQETFRAVLENALQEECSMDLMQSVHGRLSDMIRQQQEDKRAEPLTMSGRDVRDVLEECGVSEEKAELFEQGYAEAFGPLAEIPAVNLIQPREYKVSTPSVSIRVDPEHSDLVETRMIDGQRYILILADGQVEVNGVNVHIDET